MSYTYPLERPASRNVTPEYESDFDSALGSYEKETKHERTSTYPTISSRCHNSRGDPIWSPHDDSSYREDVKRQITSNTDDEISSLFQKSTMNLFGRTFKETLADFPKIARQSSKRDYYATPSLTSDDTPSRSSSSYVASPSPVHSNYTSPPSSAIRSHPARKIQSFSENVAARPFYDLPSVHLDESAIRTFEPDSYRSRTTSVEREPHIGRQPIPFKERNMVIEIHDSPIPRTPTKVYNAKAPFINVIEDEEEEEIDELMDDDDYIPEPQDLPPTPSKPVRRKRCPKLTGPFECDHCSKSFTRNYDKKRHMNSVHGKPSEDDIISRSCSCCGVVLSRNDASMRHVVKAPKACFKYAAIRQFPLTREQKAQITQMVKVGQPPRFPQELFGKGPGGLYEEQC